MKKLLICLLVLMCAVTSFGISNSADNPRATFGNGYAWTGHNPKDKAQTWAQEMEGKTITNVTAGSTTLTSASSQYVIVIGTSGFSTSTVVLPEGVAGEYFTIIDNSASETTHVVTANASNVLQTSQGTTTDNGTIANKGAITFLCINAKTTSTLSNWVALYKATTWTLD